MCQSRDEFGLKNKYSQETLYVNELKLFSNPNTVDSVKSTWFGTESSILQKLKDYRPLFSLQVFPFSQSINQQYLYEKFNAKINIVPEQLNISKCIYFKRKLY